MGAIVVAIMVGVVAFGLVAGLIALGVLALTGIKAVTAAHDSGAWLVNWWQRRRAGG